MKKKISYLIGGLIIYSILGIAISYISFSLFNWSFIFSWTIFMTLADFFIIRTIKKYFSNKQNKHA